MTPPLDARRLDTLLRSCVSCGLCLPTCATYLATGDETCSPRGRLLLLGEVMADRLAPDAPGVEQAFETCLGCMACSATCPSGVSFDLLETLNSMGRRPTVGTQLLDRPGVLRALHQSGGAARSVLRRTLGDGWRQRLASAPRPLARLSRLLGIMPDSPEADHALLDLLDRLTGLRTVDVTLPSPPAATGPRVAWFTGCADAALLPGTQRRLGEFLVGQGCTLQTVPDEACCGALAAHTGRPDRAADLRRKNLEAFGPLLQQTDHLVVAASGCGHELSRHDDDLARRTLDAVVLMDRLAPSDLGAVPLRVAVHDPCHARHGQGIVDEPRRLLRRIPSLRILEPAEPHVCCGGAGVYGVDHPDLAAAMGRRKAQHLIDTGCRLVVTTNPGCLGHLADALAMLGADIPILPLSDVVWYAWLRGLNERTTP